MCMNVDAFQYYRQSDKDAGNKENISAHSLQIYLFCEKVVEYSPWINADLYHNIWNQI